MRVATRAIGRTAVDGGYAPLCDPDGGGRATAAGSLPRDAMVIGPDGTAAVGLIGADAYALLGEEVYRTVSLDAARALARTQRVTGGWPGLVNGEGYTRLAYRRSEPAGGRDDGSDLRGAVTVDGLRVLLTVADQTGDAEILAAAEYGLRAMLNAQLADGGWPAALPLPDGDGRFACLAEQVTPGLLQLLLARPAQAVERQPGARGIAATDRRRRRLAGHAETRRGSRPGRRGAGCGGAAGPGRGDGRAGWLAPLARLGDALADHPELRARLAAGLRAPAAERSRTERARLTAARAPGVAEWVGALDGRGHWLVDGRVSVARYVAAMNELLVYLRDYEPLPDFPGNQGGRPPQHRR